MDKPLHSIATAESVTGAPVTLTLDQHKLKLYMHRLSLEQHLIKGILSGLAAAVAGAVVWAVVTVVTGYQIGYMAVAISFAVGYVMRTMGRGVDKVFGVMGALLALLGCVLGNFLGICGSLAEENTLGYLEVLQTLDYSYVPTLMMEAFSPIDLLFYSIALYQGYKISFRHVTQEELLANASTGPVTFQL